MLTLSRAFEQNGSNTNVVNCTTNLGKGPLSCGWSPYSIAEQYRKCTNAHPTCVTPSAMSVLDDTYTPTDVHLYRQPWCGGGWHGETPMTNLARPLTQTTHECVILRNNHPMNSYEHHTKHVEWWPHTTHTAGWNSGRWDKDTRTQQSGLGSWNTNTQTHESQSLRTMWVDSGWWDKKSMMRHGSCWLFLGLGLKACTISGNFMPSRIKKTGILLPTCGLWWWWVYLRVHVHVCSSACL